MTRFFKSILMLCCLSSSIIAQEEVILSPDGQLKVTIDTKNGMPSYAVSYKERNMLADSPLGLITNIGDFSRDMVFVSSSRTPIDEHYRMTKTKVAEIHYQANEWIGTWSNKEGKKINIVFRVADNDIAFQYRMPMYGETACCVVEKEASGFHLPDGTTTFLTPQASPMIGWKRTKPSYEEEYLPDAPMNNVSMYQCGYTFPALFRLKEDGWMLISETGVRSLYCASHLSDVDENNTYRIAFPSPGENNGIGSANAALALPAETPWRTITVGETLKPIVETTVQFDVVKPLYEPSCDYKFGRSTWSWIVWQDASMCYDDQITFVDLAAQLGYEYILMDALWDTQVGYERMPSLFKYAQSKGVDVFLWYNSNGYWNDAPQGAKHRMANSIERKKEMKWLKDHGVKGLKVDFFGGDKQETMKLYEDILSDANDYGLMIIFHGCTLPRGWERMYPNYVSSEAVLASENLIFNQHFDDNEAFNATLHPFIRNTVGSMDFGGTLLNKRYNRQNDGGCIRRTSDIFQLATAVLFQSPIQNFAITPNNLTDVPAFEIDFMKTIPTTWDETRFVDGYPGKYCILARRHKNKWYIAGINAEKSPLKLTLDLSMLNEGEVIKYDDNKKREARQSKITIKKDKKAEITIQPEGGVILVQ